MKMSGKSKFQISRSLDERIKRIISGSGEPDSEFSKVDSAYILGFNYGNVTNCVGLTTNYQLHHAVFPVVGLAFFKSSPIDEDVKVQLRSIKEYSSSPNGLGSFKSDKNEHLFLIYSVDPDTKDIDKRIFNISKGAFVRRKRHRLNILNDPFCPRHVYNGPDELNLDDIDSMSSAEDDQIDHLIFFIHGVGGVCDVRFRSCVEVVADFKKMANSLLAQHSNHSSGASTPTNRQLANHLRKGIFRKHSSESDASRDSNLSDAAGSGRARVKRVECLPISWHSLTRRQTGMNEQLNLIALNSVPKLRHFLNKVVIDSLLYSSGPVYTQTIVNNVGNEINRLYALFKEKHPNFNGSVSLAGHSLGSVILFDLLAHQIPNREHGPDCKLSKNSSKNAESTNCEFDDNHNNDREDDCCNNGTCPTVSDDINFCSKYKNLEELLKSMNLSQYAEVFHREHIDINNLLLLTDLDLKELRLPLGARRKLGTYINFKKVENSLCDICPNKTKCANHHENCNTQSQTTGKKDIFHNMNTGQYLTKYPQLDFKPRCFFAFGCPMPMFLSIRGIQNLSPDYKLPTCDRMLNIFHPYDPLAYRFEPLIDPRFKNVEPVQLPHHRGGKRIHVQIREGFARVGHDIKHRFLDSLRNTWSSFTRSNVNSATNDPRTQRSQSIDETTARVGRMTKSASSSVEVEVESLESCKSTSVSSTENHHDTNANEHSQRKPLKRQQQIHRSRSEINNGANSLSSIIEGSTPEIIAAESESDPNCSDVIDHLKSFKLDNAFSMKPETGSVAGKSESEMEDGVQSSVPKRLRLSDHTSRQQDGETSLSGEAKRMPGASNMHSPDEEFDPSKVGRLNCGRRVDHVLQEKPIELFNEYIFAFTSHANYWQNEDSALIILNEIYQVDGVQLFDVSD